jgi:hypothetical protein
MRYRQDLQKRSLIGTHSKKLHHDCSKILMKNGYAVECDENETKSRSDEPPVAGKDIHRLFNVQNISA